MNQKLYELALDLHQNLEEHPSVLLLKEYEKAMLKDSTVKALIEQYDALQEEINSLLESCDLENKAVKTKCSTLYKLKYVLDNEPLVKRYNKQYNLVNKMYKNITEELTNAVGIKKEIKCLLKDE